MIKQTFVASIFLIGILFASAFTVSAEINKITITDDLNDVTYNETGTPVDPNDDIHQLICEQDGKDVTITLTLAEGGEIQQISYNYLFYLVTTHYSYEIYYFDLSSFEDFIDPEYLEEEEIETLTIFGYGNFEGEEEKVTNKDYDVVDNSLIIDMTLLDSKEKIVTCSGFLVGTEAADSINYGEDELAPILPSANGPYNTTVNENIVFSGSLSEENESDYEWYWVIENDLVLSGQETSYKFNVPNEYEGILFVFNETGVYGEDSFSLTITGSGSNGNGGNGGDDSGSGLMFFIIIIAVIAIAGVAVLVFALRR